MHIVDETDFLQHHGIIGMKWGVRHGPPYPLDSNVSTGSRLKKPSVGSKHRLTDKQKKALKTAATVGVAAVGVYAAYKMGAFDAAKTAIGAAKAKNVFTTEQLRSMGIDVFEPERIKIDRVEPERILLDPNQGMKNLRANGIDPRKFEASHRLDVRGLPIGDGDRRVG